MTIWDALEAAVDSAHELSVWDALAIGVWGLPTPARNVELGMCILYKDHVYRVKQIRRDGPLRHWRVESLTGGRSTDFCYHAEDVAIAFEPVVIGLDSRF